MSIDAPVRWSLRLGWVALPFAAGDALGAALASASPHVRTLASAGLWGGWAAGVVAVAIPRPASLTAGRILAPAALVATLAAAAAGHPAPVGIALAGVLSLAALTAEVAEVYASGAAYPNERRHPLRAPAVVSALLAPLAWTVAVGGVAAGPLLLAAHRWVPGAVATVVGLPLAAGAVRSLHLLARRWAVLVPAGLVLHDPMTLREPVLFERRVIEVLGPAAAGTPALDLTAAAPGLALELVCTVKVPMARAVGRGRWEEGSSAHLMFVPARPGRLLAAAAARGINVAPARPDRRPEPPRRGRRRRSAPARPGAAGRSTGTS